MWQRPCHSPGEPVLTKLPNGDTIYLYDTAHLAFALGRTYNTIRQWEIAGILPSTPFRGNDRNRPTYTRLYTQEHIDVVVMYAEKYKTQKGRWISGTPFSKKCFEAFAELQKKYLGG